MKTKENKIPVCRQARHEYLINYYGECNTSEINGDVYYYWNGKVAVKEHGWQEVTDFEQLVNRLL